MMKSFSLLIIILFTSTAIFADEIPNELGDTLSFSKNAKLYNCALISGMGKNTQIQFVQNSGYEFFGALFGIPYTLNYSLDGVELNSIIDGGINLLNFNGSYYNQPKISSLSGFSPISTIELISENPSATGFSAYTHFGNNKLLANIEGNYRKNNFFVLTHLNYNNQNAYKVPVRKSELSIDSNNYLRNSEFEGKSIFVKTGIIEDYSELTAEYLHVNNSRNIPQNYTSTVPEYLKEKQYKTNLMSIIYKSKLTSFASLRGKFYYRDTKRILDSYDDATYSTQQSDRAYRNLTKEQVIGFDISTIMNFSETAQSELGGLYKRMQLYEKADYSLKSFDYVNEILGLKYGQILHFGPRILLNGNFVYKYINPVYPANNGLADKSLFEYNLGIKHKLGDNFEYSVSYSKNGAYPYIKYIYSKNAPVLENNFCDIAQLKTDFKLFNIPIQVNGFYSDFSNYFKSSGELARLTGKTTGAGIALQKQFKFVNLDLSYTYLKQMDWNKLFPKLSENNFYFSLSKEYDIGLKWQIESRILSGIGASTNPTKLFDIWVQQRIIDYINVFGYVNNILNEYYELFPGYPAQGLNFCLGINVEI